MKKMIITFIMALCMFITALPVMAFASEERGDLLRTESDTEFLTETETETDREDETELPETETEPGSAGGEETESEPESVSEEESETEQQSTDGEETKTEPESTSEAETETKSDSTEETETEPESDSTEETETEPESTSEEETEPQSSEPATPKKEEKAPGYLRITKRDSESGERLRGAVFGVYAAGTDNSVGEATTDRKGVAELKMEQGDYYMLELAAPDGYELDEEKIRFSIQPGKTTEKTVGNRKKPEKTADDTAKDYKNKGTSDGAGNKGSISTIQQESVMDSPIEESGDSVLAEKAKQPAQTDNGKYGTLQIKNAAAGTGRKLSGAVFAVYGDGDKKINTLTLQDGEAALSLPAGGYYLKQQEAPAGYGVERARILFSISAGKTTVVEVTSETDLSNTNPQVIIPKTGEMLPVCNYVLSALCFLTAAVSALAFYRMEKKNRRRGGM